MRILVVLADPDPVGICHRMASRLDDCLRASGHVVTVRDLCAEGFVVSMSSAERAAYHGEEPVLDPMVRDHVAEVTASEALVFVYPTTLTTLPAILKGWLERVMVPGVGFVFDSRHRVRPGLTHVRHVIGIATYPTGWVATRIANDNGRRTLTRALRLSTGLRTRVRWLAVHPTDTAEGDGRDRVLARVDELAGRL